MNWIKENAIQVLVIAAGIIIAWGSLGARVLALETKVALYPSSDYFDLKFQNIDEKLKQLELRLEKVDKNTK